MNPVMMVIQKERKRFEEMAERNRQSEAAATALLDEHMPIIDSLISSITGIKVSYTRHPCYVDVHFHDRGESVILYPDHYEKGNYYKKTLAGFIAPNELHPTGPEELLQAIQPYKDNEARMAREYEDREAQRLARWNEAMPERVSKLQSVLDELLVTKNGEPVTLTAARRMDYDFDYFVVVSWTDGSETHKLTDLNSSDGMYAPLARKLMTENFEVQVKPRTPKRRSSKGNPQPGEESPLEGIDA